MIASPAHDQLFAGWLGDIVLALPRQL